MPPRSRPLRLAAAAALTFLLALPAAGCREDDPDPAEAAPADSAASGAGATAPAASTVLGAIREAGLSTFETAITRAGLVDSLRVEGPFTVFAPTNAAFEALPAGRLDSLIQSDAYLDALRALVEYHVVQGRLETTTVDVPTTYDTRQRGALTVARTAGGVTVTDAGGTSARVVTPDLNRANGVVHVIDAVLTPPDVVPTDSAAADAAPSR